MPRPSLLGGLRRPRPAQPDQAAVPAGPPRRATPPPNELRRERRVLLRLREERIRDLGGLVLEMVRRDAFRETLVLDQCAELLGIEERLGEIESLLAVRRPPAARCACGAPLFWQSHFCGNCGRAAGAHAQTVCASCGHALAADSQFCPACGTPSVDESRS